MIIINPLTHVVRQIVKDMVDVMVTKVVKEHAELDRKNRPWYQRDRNGKKRRY